MAIAVPPSLNGRPRKQLSDQLDRMDDLINGLEECLPQAVAEAARDGIRQAFREVLGELLVDPAGLDRLRNAIAVDIVPAASKPSAFARLKAIIKSATNRVISTARHTVRVIAAAPRKFKQKTVLSGMAVKTRLAQAALMALPVKTMVGSSLVVGIIVAAVCYFAPHHVAAMVSGFCAAFTAIGLQITRWFRRRAFCMA